MKPKNRISVGAKVIPIRENISASAAQAIGDFYFWNPGVVKKIDGDRLKVAWDDGKAFFFDLDQIKSWSEQIAMDFYV